MRAGPLLALTIQVTLPLPVPLAPAVTLIQLNSLVAVHAQPAGAVTKTYPGSAAEVCDRLVSESSYVQTSAGEGREDVGVVGVGVVGVVGTRSVQATRPSAASDAHARREQERG
jgi:hypothetical protein